MSFCAVGAAAVAVEQLLSVGRLALVSNHASVARSTVACAPPAITGVLSGFRVGTVLPPDCLRCE